MEDYIVRATAAEHSVRAFAIRSTNLVEEARKHHGTTPVMTAALGRLLSAGAMMGSMMKGEKDVLTLRIKSDGPGQGLMVTAKSNGEVKGFAYNPKVIIPPKYPGKLDVGGAIGSGILSVTRDIGLKEPYSGQCLLQTGEIGDDLCYYFTTSEQTPSVVGLGVYVEKDRHVDAAGGFIIQLMPGATEETICALEEKTAKVKSVTDLLRDGKTPEDILTMLLGDLNLEILEKSGTKFCCDCSKEKISEALSTIDPKDIREMIRDGKPIEVVCDFCSTKYVFSTEELTAVLERQGK